MNKTGIYKITNVINNHAYIGLSINIERRWKEHRKMKYRAAIYDAFKKYGIENFTFEILEEYSKEQLSNKEIYWISFYNTYYNGYNSTKGGEGSYGSGLRKSVVQYDKNGNFIQIFESISEAERILGINQKSSNITRVCQGKAYESNGYQWRYLDESKNYEENIGKSPLKDRLKHGSKKAKENRTYISNKVAKCDKKTHQIISVYDSIKEANEKTNICSTSIYKVCNKTRQSAGGYYWIYI